MGPAQGRRALHELEPIWREDAQQRSLIELQQTLEGSAVEAHPLHRPRVASIGAIPDAQLVLPAGGVQPHDDPRREGSEAHELALVTRARGAAGAAEVERL